MGDTQGKMNNSFCPSLFFISFLESGSNKNHNQTNCHVLKEAHWKTWKILLPSLHWLTSFSLTEELNYCLSVFLLIWITSTLWCRAWESIFNNLPDDLGAGGSWNLGTTDFCDDVNNWLEMENSLNWLYLYSEKPVLLYSFLVLFPFKWRW